MFQFFIAAPSDRSKPTTKFFQYEGKSLIRGKRKSTESQEMKSSGPCSNSNLYNAVSIMSNTVDSRNEHQRTLSEL